MSNYKSKRNKLQQKNHSAKLSLSKLTLKDTFLDEKQSDRINDHKNKTNKISSVFHEVSSVHNQITAKNGFKYYENKGDKMFTCAQYLTYAISNNADKKLTGVFRCGSRFCSFCQNFHINRRIAYLERGIKEKDISSFENIQYVSLTLTVENPPIGDLKSTLAHMNQSFQRLVERKKWKQSVVGFIKSTEVSKGTIPGRCHPHFHVIMAVKKNFFGRCYRSKMTWVEDWHSCLKYSQDEKPTIYVKKVKSNHDPFSAPLDHLEQILHENIKYSIKPSELLDDVDFFIKLEDELRGAQFFQTNGLFKELFKLGRASFDKAREQESAAIVDVISFFFKKKYRKIDLTDAQKQKLISEANERNAKKDAVVEQSDAHALSRFAVYDNDVIDDTIEIFEKIDEKIKRLADNDLKVLAEKTSFSVSYYHDIAGAESAEKLKFEEFELQLSEEIERRKKNNNNKKKAMLK